MNKDIKALLAIYTILILVGWNIALNNEVKKEQKAKIEAMKLSIELNNANDKYIDMLQSMNDYADDLHLRIETLENQSQIIKDLRSSR